MDGEGQLDDFIATRRSGVLHRAIVALGEASAADIGAVAHRLLGTLGSYGLDEATDAIRSLELLARRGSGTRSELEASRAETLRTLTEVAASLPMPEE